MCNSYRLELMRQIYNSSDSPPDSFANYSTESSPTETDSDQTTPTNPPINDTTNNYFFNATTPNAPSLSLHSQANDLFQCFQTTCATVVANSANKTRLSLAHLIPSRQENLYNNIFSNFLLCLNIFLFLKKCILFFWIQYCYIR